jgi:hypothetical protein
VLVQSRDVHETYFFKTETRPRPQASRPRRDRDFQKFTETRPRSRLGHRLKYYNGCVTRERSKCMMQFEFSVFCLLELFLNSMRYTIISTYM